MSQSYCLSLWFLSWITFHGICHGESPSESCSGTSNSEMSDHMSMLQVGINMVGGSTRKLHAPPLDVEGLLRIGSNGITPFLINKETGEEAKSNEDGAGYDWRDREYNMVAHHKSGTVMSNHAAAAMSTAMSMSPTFGKPVPIQSFWNTLGIAYAPAMMQTVKPSCFAHVARNPFEMVVSNLFYTRAGAEGWMYDMPFSETASAGDRGGPLLMPQGAWRYLWNRGMGVVYQSTLSGPFSHKLPDANATETFKDYINRVDDDAGLIAVSIWSNEIHFPSMRFVEDYVKPRPCGINVCYGDFYENCNATWKSVLEAWQIPDPQKGELLRAVAPECPTVSKGAIKHSSDDWMKQKDLAHAPQPDMVKRLKELDRLVLNGTLAAVEESVGCKLSGKYK